MTRLDRLLLHVPRLRSLILQRDEFVSHCARLQAELVESLERERVLRKELEEAGLEARAFLGHGNFLQRELAGSLEREQVLRNELEAAGNSTTAPDRTRAGALRSLQPEPEVPGRGDLLCRKMRDDWDGRALSQGLYFIATGQPDWTEDSFFRSGEENVRDHILTDLGNICRGKDPKQMRVVEIGCGAGRLTRALAAIFGEVHAVDVSPEMIRLAREKLAGRANVHLYLNNGTDLSMLPSGTFHFAFSFIVFQHIPDQAIIEQYVRETHRVLEPGALFKFQVEGGLTAQPVPDDTWHGVSFTKGGLGELARHSGFDLRYTEGAGTQYFWAWFFKPGATSS
jgi:SAM-dependent methyltransferase